jgi:hypothetical protein
MTPGELIELLLRGGAIGFFVALAIGLARDLRQPARLTGAAFGPGALDAASACSDSGSRWVSRRSIWRGPSPVTAITND